jgi:membrane protein
MAELPQQNDRRVPLNVERLRAAARHLGRVAVTRVAMAGRFLHFAAQRFLRDRCLDQAASLSYTTLLSLVPFVALCVVVVSVVPQFQDLRDDIERLFTGNLLPEASNAAVDQFRRFVQKAGRLTGFGIAGLALAAALLLAAIDMAFDTIWRAHRQRSIIVRVLAYGAVLALGPLLIGGSLSLQGLVLTTGKHLGGVAFTKGMRTAAPLLLIIGEAVALMLLYRFVPTQIDPPDHIQYRRILNPWFSPRAIDDAEARMRTLCRPGRATPVRWSPPSVVEIQSSVVPTSSPDASVTVCEADASATPG